MPLGIVIMLVASYAIYRRAASMGKSPINWVAFLWVSTIVCGLIALYVVGPFFVVILETSASESDLRMAMQIPAIIGMTCGVVIPFYRLSRISSPTVSPKDETNGSPPEANKKRKRRKKKRTENRN